MNETYYRYFILYKPVNMLSQFVGAEVGPFLGDLGFKFPEGSHAIGRLDKESEGLLLVCTNKKVTKLLFESKVPHRRTYLVQVLQKMTPETLQKLREGVSIRIGIEDYWTTSPCEAEIIDKPSNLAVLENELKDFIPQTWLRITLTEGKFRQVRKMVFTLRHKCRRLIRESIEGLNINEMSAGDVREISEEDFFTLLKL
ncbi:MAG: rRNA pseudouridine synthase [Chitinophagaceae bacterium]|nr:rRNA pseudouridine synthase [Chitinophagaceae bacterium]